MPSAFENFVNAELPLRVSAAVLPLANTTGHYVTDATTSGRGSVWVKDNYAGGAAPGVSNDNTERYGVGSLWYDTVGGSMYLCTDASTGAAVWVSVGGGSMPTVQQIVDGILQAAREGHPAESIGEGVMIAAAGQKNRALFDWDAGTLTVYKADGSTVKYTKTISEPSATEIQFE